MTPARRPTRPAGRRAPLRGKTRVRAFSIGSDARGGESGTVDGLRQPVAAERPSVEGGAKTLGQARPPQSSRWAKSAPLHAQWSNRRYGHSGRLKNVATMTG